MTARYARAMRVLLVVVAITSVTAVAAADAIMPFEGECPPGLERGIRDHSEACIPLVCGDGRRCPMGSSCQTLCVCRAEREFTNDGRVVYDEPRRMVVEVGLCDASGACDEGDVGVRRQCEPGSATPAFDPRAHRWTGEPHTGGCAGCAVPGPRASAPPAFIVLLALLALRRRRR